MSGSAGSRRRSDGAGRISRSDRMVSGRRWGSRGRGSLIRHFQSLRMRRRQGAGRCRGRISRSVRIAGMGCGSAGIDVRRVIRCLEQPLPEDAVRCRGCGRVYEGNMLRFCPACGCRLLDTPVEILPELTAEERVQYAAGHCEVCPHCRGPVPDVEGLKYCPHCGFEVSTKQNRQAFWGKFFYCLFVAILIIALFVMM